MAKLTKARVHATMRPDVKRQAQIQALTLDTDLSTVIEKLLVLWLAGEVELDLGTERTAPDEETDG